MLPKQHTLCMCRIHVHLPFFIKNVLIDTFLISFPVETSSLSTFVSTNFLLNLERLRFFAIFQSSQCF